MKIKTILNAIAILIVSQTCIGQEKPEYNKEAIEINDKAIKYMLAFKLDSALTLFDNAIELDKTYYLPHLNKFGIYIEQKRFDKALNEAEMALKKNPDMPEGWVLAGILRERQGDTDKANQY